MKITDWDEAMGKLYEEGDQYTPIDSKTCEKIDDEYMNCDI